MVGLGAVGGLAIGANIMTTIQLSDGGRTADGFVIDYEESNVEINGETVMGIRYRFEAEGTQYEGQSYSRGDLPDIDEKVLIEYVQNAPHRSRIIGLDAGAVPLWLAGIFLIFLLAGVALISVNYRTGRRWSYLLEWGVETDGEVIGQRATGVTVNSEAQFEMTISYNDDTGAQHRASMRTFYRGSKR